jgi:hypothetical protein
MSLPTHPYTKAQVKKFARQAVEDGRITYSRPHALDRMRQRNASTVDVENVLRGGFCDEEPELKDGTWRYKIRSNTFIVVIEFWPDERLFVVTVIRPGR